MKVAAPGKLLLGGAYAVLHGATAVVAAVDRLVVADGGRAGDASREVRAAIGDRPAPYVETASLYDEGKKLGLGSSAAVLVATLGLARAEAGDDLRDAAVRRAIFDDARRAHAVAQGGGSGVDVAASVFGGVLAYRLEGGGAVVRPLAWPEAIFVDAVWSGTSARTSDLRARVDALAARDPATHDARMRDLAAASDAMARALGAESGGRDADEASVPSLLAAARATFHALEALGRDADAPIVPPAAHAIAEVAEAEGAAFYPSGAGGGDVAVLLHPDRPSRALLAALDRHHHLPLAVRFDREGLRTIR